MNKTLIITGGTINEQFLAEEAINSDYETIIAVDKGLETAKNLNLKIHYIIGDFDSVNTKILEDYKFSAKINKLKPEKDYTDTHMALKLAINLKSDDVTIIGWSGTRVDHVLANIHIIKEALDNNVHCILKNKTNEIELINRKTIITKNEKFKYISLIPFTTETRGITLKGFKYPLESAILKIGESIGISNEIIEDKAIIDIKEGILILIKSKD